MSQIHPLILSDAGAANILKKSSTEEILSHSVSETNRLPRQKELEKLQKRSTMESEASGQDNSSIHIHIKVVTANPSKAPDELFKVKFNSFFIIQKTALLNRISMLFIFSKWRLFV